MRAFLIAGFLATAYAAQNLYPPPVFPDSDMDRVKLGQLLYYDPVLTGNCNISGATCPHPKFRTGHRVSLAIGEGGIGLGPARKPVPANNNSPDGSSRQ